MDSQKILIPDKHIPTKKPLKSDRDILEELLKKINQMQISNDQMKESGTTIDKYGETVDIKRRDYIKVRDK